LRLVLTSELPSEGRGHRFESCRARQLKQQLKLHPAAKNFQYGTRTEQHP